MSCSALNGGGSEAGISGKSCQFQVTPLEEGVGDLVLYNCSKKWHSSGAAFS